MATQGTALIDFGASPVNEASFNVVDGTLAGLTYAEAWFMRDSTGDNGVTEHEQAAAMMRTACSISGTTLTIACTVLLGFVTGQFSIRWAAN